MRFRRWGVFYQDKRFRKRGKVLLKRFWLHSSARVEAQTRTLGAANMFKHDNQEYTVERLTGEF